MAQVNPVLAGLACRCPNCGEGKLFAGFLKVAPRCEVCGLDLAKADSGDGPAVFIILIVGFAVTFSMLIVEFTLHPPLWLHLVIWPIVIGVLGVGLMRPFKGVLIALQFHHRSGEGGASG
jgi:uncharacterized protein (DUF983 family)